MALPEPGHGRVYDKPCAGRGMYPLSLAEPPHRGDWEKPELLEGMPCGRAGGGRRFSCPPVIRRRGRVPRPGKLKFHLYRQADRLQCGPPASGDHRRPGISGAAQRKNRAQRRDRGWAQVLRQRVFPERGLLLPPRHAAGGRGPGADVPVSQRFPGKAGLQERFLGKIPGGEPAGAAAGADAGTVENVPGGCVLAGLRYETAAYGGGGAFRKGG